MALVQGLGLLEDRCRRCFRGVAPGCGCRCWSLGFGRWDLVLGVRVGGKDIKANGVSAGLQLVWGSGLRDYGRCRSGL